MSRQYERYDTPLPTIYEFLEAYFKNKTLDTCNMRVLDPCCGGGAYKRMLLHYGVQAYNVITMDIDPKVEDATYKGVNFLNINKKLDVDMVVSNPPFSLITEFVDKSLTMLSSDDGVVAFLVPISIFGSKKRKVWWGLHPPMEIYIHSHRPRFIDSSSAPMEYAHIVWGRKPNPTGETIFKVI